MLYISPIPDEGCLQSGDRFREVGVAAAPLVHHLGASDAQTLSDLVGTHEIFWIHLLPHGFTIGPRDLRVVDVRTQR
jgi:hypothetical protein